MIMLPFARSAVAQQAGLFLHKFLPRADWWLFCFAFSLVFWEFIASMLEELAQASLWSWLVADLGFGSWLILSWFYVEISKIQRACESVLGLTDIVMKQAKKCRQEGKIELLAGRKLGISSLRRVPKTELKFWAKVSYFPPHRDRFGTRYPRFCQLATEIWKLSYW